MRTVSAVEPPQPSELPNEDVLYERALRRDGSYDGRFLIGVLTTGIYCLPSCAARKPHRENVRFFRSEAEALAAGLRPCKRCRPDAFYRGESADAAAFEGLLAQIARELPVLADPVTLARSAEIGTSALHRLVRAHAHLTPAALLRRSRVAEACRRLIETDEPVLEIGFAVGFEAESTYHRTFLSATGLSPGAYRALRDARTFVLRLPPSYRAADALAYHGRDPASPSERVAEGTIVKAVRVGTIPARLEITFDGGSARCAVTAAGSGDRPFGVEAHAVAVRLLGLAADPGGFERRVAVGDPLSAILARRPGLRLPQTSTVFEALTWAIVGQQVHLGLAAALRRELVALVGPRLSDGLIVPPGPDEVAQLDVDDLGRRRFSRAKAHALVRAARTFAGGGLETLPDGSAPLARRVLLACRGIGPWSANYVLMRGCGFADCLPLGDSGLTSALRRLHVLPERPDAGVTERLMAPYAPFRSLATAHLWASLGDPA
jgi:AraC family transcriptional regulator, regulatory protein of adaptative response / DNA-3-methyladenine glycosylase II